MNYRRTWALVAVLAVLEVAAILAAGVAVDRYVAFTWPAS